MAKLHGLIRLKEHELDEKRRALGELNKKIEALEQKKRDRLDQMEREKKLAAQNPEQSGDVGLYIEQSLKFARMVDRQIGLVMVEVEKARDEVAEAFLEYKRIEIAQARRDAEALAALQRLETEILDEIGQETFRRAQ